MKKKFYFLILIVAYLTISQSVVAQSNGFVFSVVGAVSKTSIFGESDSWKDPIGFQAGVIVPVVNINESLSLRAEANISLQGARYVDFEVSGTVSLMYVNLPLVGRYQTKSGLFGEVGIQPGFLLSAKDKYSGRTDDYKKFVNKFDFSVPVGIGKEFDNNIGVGIRVILGLNNVNSDNSSKDHNLVFALRGTYTLGKK